MLPRNADSLFVNIPQRGSTECMFKQSETWETMRYYILPALLSVLLFCWMLMKCPTLFYTLTEMDVCVRRSVSSPLPAFFSSFFFLRSRRSRRQLVPTLRPYQPVWPSTPFPSAELAWLSLRHLSSVRCCVCSECLCNKKFTLSPAGRGPKREKNGKAISSLERIRILSTRRLESSVTV